MKKKEKFVAAGGGLNIIFGIGAMAGPIICSAMMNLLGPNGLFVHFILFYFYRCNNYLSILQVKSKKIRGQP